MLPKMIYGANIAKQPQTAFGGLDMRLSSGNGLIRHMSNLTGDYAPVLATRRERWKVATLEKPNGLFAAGKLFWVDGETLYADGEAVGNVADNRKLFCALGERVVIWPDKMIYTLDGVLESLEARYCASGLVFGNGTYADETAEANSITTTGDAFPFRPGDAVTISGCTVCPENNKTIIVREISEDGKTLRFYENSFTMTSEESEDEATGETVTTYAESVTETGEVELARTAPDLDYLCEHENRLWGGKGDTIWCCKLGDPYNWNVFDGVSTDAWSVDMGSAGVLTGCTAFLGYPIFMKEGKVYKVYGSKPTNYELLSSATLGTVDDGGSSYGVAGETLFYLSRAGIVAYSGGIPSIVSEALGEMQLVKAVGGSDGLKYYCSATDTEGGAHLLVYDAQKGLWHREDGLQAAYMAYLDGLYALCENGELWLLGNPAAVPEGAEAEGGFESEAVFGDWDWNSMDSKFPTRLRLRLETDEGTTLAVQISYDGGDWETAATAGAGRKRNWYLPVPIRRCDHYKLRIAANGPWKLFALEHEFYSGSGSRK